MYTVCTAVHIANKWSNIKKKKDANMSETKKKCKKCFLSLCGHIFFFHQYKLVTRVSE